LGSRCFVRPYPAVMRRVIVIGLLFVSACSSGPGAPAVGGIETVCNELFCVDVPGGWEAEIGGTYLSFNHDLDPDHTFLTVGVIDMEAIVENAGGTWPVSRRCGQVRAFGSPGRGCDQELGNAHRRRDVASPVSDRRLRGRRDRDAGAKRLVGATRRHRLRQSERPVATCSRVVSPCRRQPVSREHLVFVVGFG